MTTFRLHQDVAVVEHDDATRQPREGGKVYLGTVDRLTDGGAYVQVKTEHWGLLSFWAESGWHAWDGSFHWRIVPVCERTACENPVLDPYREQGDPLHREWCSERCHTLHAEAWAEQHYPSGVAT